MCPREKGNSIILSDSLQGEFCTICQKVIQTKKGPISAFVFLQWKGGKNLCRGKKELSSSFTTIFLAKCINVFRCVGYLWKD